MRDSPAVFYAKQRQKAVGLLKALFHFWRRNATVLEYVNG